MAGPVPATTSPANAPSMSAVEVTARSANRAERARQSAEAIKVVELDNARRESADLGELLARTQGVGVRRSGGLGSSTRFSLNGLSDEQIRFFVDGIPLELTGFALGLANVPVNLIREVEIHSGVVPIRFGADALGGAINLVTTGFPPGPRSSASYQVGSYGTHRATLSGQFCDPQGLALRMSGFFDEAKNDYPVDVEVPDERGRPVPVTVRRFHDGYRAGGANVDLGWTDTPWARSFMLHGYGTVFGKQLQHDLTMAPPPYGGVTYGEHTFGGRMHYRSPADRRWHADLLSGYAHTRGHYLDVDRCTYNWRGECVVERPRGGEAGPASDLVVWQHTGYGRATASFEPAPHHHLSLSTAPTGVWRRADERRQQDPTLPDAQGAERKLLTWVTGLEYRGEAFNETLAAIVFAKHYLQRARSEEALPGPVFVRRDRNTSRFGAGASARQRLVGPLAVKASYEWATRLPGPFELFGNASTLLPNLTLRPESSHNLNVDLLLVPTKTTWGQLRAQVTGFLRETRDLIRLARTNMFMAYQNLDAARSLGTEVAAGWVSPGEHVSAEANLTYQSFRNTSRVGRDGETRGDRIPNQPWLFANLSLRYRVRRLLTAHDEASLAGYLRYVHRFQRDWESVGLQSYNVVIDSYLVPSLVATYLVKLAATTWSVTFEVDNVSDSDVRDYYGVQRPGRTFFGKVTAVY